MTFLSIIELKLISVIEFSNVSSEIRRRGCVEVHSLSSCYVLITASALSALKSFYRGSDVLFE